MRVNRARVQYPGEGLNYRTMRSVSLAFGMVAALALGYATSAFDLSEPEAMIVGGLFVLGLVPPNIYLHFIAKAATRNSPPGSPPAEPQ